MNLYFDIEEVSSFKPIEVIEMTDDRYECRRRPVWKRKNVFASSSESARVMKKQWLIYCHLSKPEAGDKRGNGKSLWRP
jgi:hypothetical protein